MSKLLVRPSITRGSGIGRNGSMYWRDVMASAAQGYCAVCRRHREACTCAVPSTEQVARIEQNESESRMDMLGYVVFGAVCVAFGVLFGLAL